MFHQPSQRLLRPHQIKAIDGLRNSLAQGNRRVVLQAGTGFGKTLTAAKIIESALAKNRKVLFTVPLLSLVDQTVSEFTKEGIGHIGVIQANHPRTDATAPVQIASVQTLARRDIALDFDLVIVDECFVGETLIETQNGSIPIADVSIGQIVHNACGLGSVVAKSCKAVRQLTVVRMSDGSCIECTKEHPFFTRDGWKKAGELEVGEMLFRREELSVMWGGVRPIYEDRKADVGDAFLETDVLLSILRKEVEKPVSQARGKAKDISVTQKDGAQAKNSGRQRIRNDRASISAAIGVGRGVGGGVCAAGLVREEGEWASRTLQNRFGEQRFDGCDRSGRGFTLHSSEKATRYEEGRDFGVVRVVSVESVKLESPRNVYNLHISGHPSYFAGGVLVHNCHLTFQIIYDLMDKMPRAVFVGLSATPWAKGMGLKWQDLIQPITLGELIETGYLSKFTAYAPDVPDLSGVKTLAGDYAEDDTARVMAGEALMASVVRTWLEKGENRPTLLFGVNRAHAKQLQEQFIAAGVSAGYCDANVDMMERHHLGRQFRNGDVRVACSVRTLTTGIDWPVSCIIDAAPTKSEMLHVQKIGRGLRVNPGTEDLIILDHAGNSLRLGLVTDIHHLTLDTSKKGEKADRKPKAEKLPKECANCAALTAERICPFCGNERKPVSGVDTVDGELVVLGAGKARIYTMGEKQQWWSAIQHIRIARGKSSGWASHTYKDKFGVWPRGLDDTPGECSQEVWNFVKAKAIRFAKAQEGKKA